MSTLLTDSRDSSMGIVAQRGQGRGAGRLFSNSFVSAVTV